MRSLRSWARSGGSDEEALELLRGDRRLPDRERAGRGARPVPLPGPRDLAAASAGGDDSVRRGLSEPVAGRRRGHLVERAVVRGGPAARPLLPGGRLSPLRRGAGRAAERAPGAARGRDRGGVRRRPRHPEPDRRVDGRRVLHAGAAVGGGAGGDPGAPHRARRPPGHRGLPSRWGHRRHALAGGAGGALRLAPPAGRRFGPPRPERAVPVPRRLPGRGQYRGAGGGSGRRRGLDPSPPPARSRFRAGAGHRGPAAERGPHRVAGGERSGGARGVPAPGGFRAGGRGRGPARAAGADHAAFRGAPPAGGAGAGRGTWCGPSRAGACGPRPWRSRS